MSLQSKRLAAAVLALTALVVGAWAAVAPFSFYRDFPLPGRQWVSLLGPYNEHLVRDVGGLYLAMLVISGWAVVRPADRLMRVVGLAWVVFGVQHFGFHVLHLGMFPAVDRAGMTVTLGGTVVLAALLMLPSGRFVPARDERSAPVGAQGERSAAR